MSSPSITGFFGRPVAKDAAPLQRCTLLLSNGGLTPLVHAVKRNRDVVDEASDDIEEAAGPFCKVPAAAPAKEMNATKEMDATVLSTPDSAPATQPASQQVPTEASAAAASGAPAP